MVTGRTYSHDGVARLLSRLQVVPDLINVQLLSSSLSTVAGHDVVEFSIAADIKVGRRMNQLKSLKTGPLLGIIVGAVLVVGLAGWFLLVRPQGAKVKSLKADAADIQAKIGAYNQQVAAARAAPKIEVADVYRLAKAMPDRTDMPDLVLELSQLARDTGIRFDSISPQPITPIGSYTVLPISVTFQGNFYNLADFLYRLRSLVTVHAGRLDATGRLFAVDTMTFNESTLKFPQIQATLVIDAFVYGNGAPAQATIPTTTTSTTSTTETTTTSSAPPAGASATGAP